ncbi:MAG: DUF488 domain-containing protein [Planctomycetota bacterium]
MRVFTVGHSNRSWVEFAALLAAHGIERIADVRSYPGSRRYPQFDRAQLERELPAVDVSYVWFGEELGGMRDYAAHMETAEFEAGVKRLLESSGRVACMCAEKLPDHCHRRFLSDALVARGVDVIHLLDKDTRVPHVVQPRSGDDHQGMLFDL